MYQKSTFGNLICWIALLATILIGTASYCQYSSSNYSEQGGARWVVGGSCDVVSGGDLDIESGGAIKIAGTAVTSSAAELNLLDTATAGTVVASKVVVVDATKQVDAWTVTGLTTTGTLASGAAALSGNVTLDDGATHSPTVVFKDAGDASFTFQKQNDGFLTGTPTEATKGFNILTGNLKVGNGTPGVTQDGEDVYIEGTLEVDAASTFDGAVDFNSTITLGTRSWNVTQYSADPNAAAWLATVSGLDADDYVVATLNTAPGNGAYLLSADASVGGATITLSADPNESVKITIISLQD